MKNRILTLIATSLSWVIGVLLIVTDSIALSVIEELGLQDGFPRSKAMERVPMSTIDPPKN